MQIFRRLRILSGHIVNGATDSIAAASADSDTVIGVYVARGLSDISQVGLSMGGYGRLRLEVSCRFPHWRCACDCIDTSLMVLSGCCPPP